MPIYTTPLDTTDDGAAAATAQPQPQAMPMYPLPSPPDQSQQQQRLLAIYLVGPLAVLLVLAREGEGGQGQEAGPDAMRAIGVEVGVLFDVYACMYRCYISTNRTQTHKQTQKVERRLLPALQQPACLGPTTLFDRFGAKGGSAGGGGGEVNFVCDCMCVCVCVNYTARIAHVHPQSHPQKPKQNS